MLCKKSACLIGFQLLFTFSTIESAPIQWGGNGHHYEFVAASGIQWSAANTEASGMQFNGVNGYLATVTSSGENEFLASILDSISPSPLSAWLGAQQLNPAALPDETWAWVTSEPFIYTNWSSGEPNDNPGISGGEQYLGMFGPGLPDGVTGTWNDQGGVNDPYVAENIFGYIVEYDTPSVPEPSTLILVIMGITGIGGFHWRRKRLVTPTSISYDCD